MKTIIYLLFIFIAALAFTSCKDDQSSQAEFAKDEVPRIFFDNWNPKLEIEVGKTVKLSPMVSPSDGATFKWTLDGSPITTTKELSYVANTIGEYELKFEVERNGVKNSRTTTLTVKQVVPPVVP